LIADSSPHVDRKTLQVEKAAVAGAEVVERHRTVQPPHVRDEHPRDALVVDQRGLRDLEDHEPRIDTMRRQLLLDVPEEPRLADRLSGQVDLDAVAGGGITHRQLEDAAIDLLDEVVLLGDREERAGRDDLAVDSDHPHEQLVLNRLAGHHVENRLGVEDQTVGVERIADPPDPAHRLQLTADPQLTRLQLGDVAECDDAAGATAEVDRRRRERHRDRGAVLALEAVIVAARGAPAGDHGGERAVRERVRTVTHELAMERRVRAEAEQLVG
jgi:hypothetical protein